MVRTILIDADILAHQIASSQEKVYEFNGDHVLHADLKIGCREVDNAVAYIIDHCGGDAAALFLTGPHNFRKQVLPSYKAPRGAVRRPMILTGLREHMKATYRTFEEPTLEGDDLMGIHATMPHKGERVIYSADKDLKQIPGLHWCPEDGEVIEVTQAEGDRFFFEQVLTGDAVDNYSGCPGIGPVAAGKFLDEPYEWFTETGDKGDRWKRRATEDLWAGIVSLYRKAGLTPKAALIQARCARILRCGEYDFKQQKVSLWNPK